MNRLSLLSVSVCAAVCTPSAFSAPLCADSLLADGTPVLTCSEAASIPVNDGRDRLQVRIESGAGIASANRNASPLDLSGAEQQVLNEGEIINSDTRSNTDAISVRGDDLTVINHGLIRSGDRAIHSLAGSGGLTVENYGEISSRRQTIRAEEDYPGAEVINHGLIESQDGRALQLRGDGARVINYGTLRGGEEVVEARGNFYMENHGEIVLRDGIADEDGVQFASGTLINHGLIRGSDDGVDIDEGLVHNGATGRIVSTGEGGNGIDVDPDFDNGIDPIRPSGPLTIINEGYIEGPNAIGADPAARSSVEIINSGTLYGRSGVAIGLAPEQGDSVLRLTGASNILGDVLFGSGNDGVFLDNLGSGNIGSGWFDGGLGLNTVHFVSYALSDLSSFLFDGERVTFSLLTSGGGAAGMFTNFAFWEFGDGSRYETSALASLLDSSNTVPTPASLPLLLTALVGLWLAVGGKRRR